MRNPFKTFSFQATFFASFILISAALIVLLGVTSYYITNQEVVDETISSRRLLLNEINKQLDLQLQAVEYDALVVASNPTVTHYLQTTEDSFERVSQSSEVVDMLSRHSYVKEAVHSVQLYARDPALSKHIAINGVFPYARLEKSPVYEMIHSADSAWFGAPLLQLESVYPGDQAGISFMRKVMSPVGKEIGVLVFNLKMSYMQNLISGQSAHGSRYIFDPSLNLIVESAGRAGDAMPYADIEEQLREVLVAEQDGRNYAVAELGGRKQLLIWNLQSRTQWMAMDMIPWEDITKGSRRIQEVIIIASVLCIVLAVVMAYLLSRQFARPIRKLVQAMNRMKMGNLDVRISNDYHNEFGHLNNNFNDMTEHIGHLIEQVNEQNRRKRDAEMRVLQEQINPHFLYNTLDMMNWHAIDSGANDISRMLSLLGKMLRIGLSSGASFIPVARELEHLRCYAELQQIRYQHHIQFEFDIPPALENYVVPKLILQPFAENSLIHGFHSGRQGRIRIVGYEEGDKLVFTVEDNGHGMDTSAMPPPRAGGHNGLRNVRERIALNFGSAYGVHIRSEPDVGTLVTVTLPKLREEPRDSIERGGEPG